ncbi:hypothetical protein RDWZM_002171 [Blomia tropicalis]|uniref:Uncharacterized protein n=1 Tax=Blomia tropicalis TaxID=40697 RepID=A0A9Q0RRC7_BLOTA|nr:hypothetical protein RDWZM_002171 [Blomia tropicalis]
MANQNLPRRNPFNPDGPSVEELWRAYKEELEAFMDASGTMNTRRRATLFYIGGPEIRRIIRGLEQSDN